MPKQRKFTLVVKNLEKKNFIAKEIRNNQASESVTFLSEEKRHLVSPPFLSAGLAFHLENVNIPTILISLANPSYNEVKMEEKASNLCEEKSFFKCL